MRVFIAGGSGLSPKGRPMESSAQRRREIEINEDVVAIQSGCGQV